MRCDSDNFEGSLHDIPTISLNGDSTVTRNEAAARFCRLRFAISPSRPPQSNSSIEVAAAVVVVAVMASATGQWW